MSIGLGIGNSIGGKVSGFGGGPAVSYLLDTYGGASAAYSVFKLSSTATNSLRARRQHDSAELDIGFVGDTLDTAALEAFTNSIFENALEFDGVNDNVSFTAIAKPALSNGLCFGFWVNFSSTPNFEYILGDSTNGNQWFRWNNSTSATFRSRSAGAATTTFSFPAISTSTWYYIAVSLNGGVNEMWINGTKYTGDTDNYDNENISFDRIGESSGAYGQFILDELFVKTESSLTQQNVDDLYNGGLGATATSVIASPNVYYKFNESGTDTTAVDASGNSNNGTLNSFPASGMWVSHPGGNYDAFVTTYYDQSGNSSNFIQASAANQPMIVNAGVVVTSGGVPAVKFNGINEYLSNTVDLFGEARLDQFFLTDTDGDTAYIFPNSSISSYYGMIAYSGNTSTTTTSPSYGSPSLYQNGVPINVTNRNTVYNDTNGRKVISHIDAVTSIWPEYRFGFWSAGILNFGGSMSALVAYTSDQSANRVGIETILDSLYNVDDPDATAYITAAGIIDPTEQAAVFQLVSDLKGTGSTTNNTDVWTGLDAIYPISPTSLAAAEYNLKDPATYQITWYNSPTHSSAGVALNGSNQYGDTGYAAINGLQNDHSLGINFSPYSGGNGALMGSRTANSPNLFNSILGYSNRTYYNVNAAVGASRSGGITSGHYIVNRDSSLVTLYKNSIDITRATNTSTGQGVNNYMIGAYNFDGVPTFLASGTMNFTHIGASLTANQVTDLYDAITTYNTAVR